MKIEQIKTLSEDELAMLWYMFNRVERVVWPNVDLEPECFTSVRPELLVARVKHCESLIKDEHKPIYKSLTEKLEII